MTQFQEKEGIALEYEKIVVNPGQRALAKLMLNSMWGMFAISAASMNNEWKSIIARKHYVKISPPI